jgi:NAD(P)-dependent dehydrogenase (short-subunit alcohol dehydrogenase family)
MTDVIDAGFADGLEAEPDVDLGDAGSLGEIRRTARYGSLEDGVVVITGGASGIGASMTAHFAAQGARVAVFDRNIAPMEPLAAVLATAGWPVPMAIEVDLTDIEAARAAVAEVERALGPVTVLVNNAANDDRHRWHEVTPAYWDERMAVNLRHQFFLAQAVAPGMAAAGGGSIINLTSTSFMIGVPDLPVYQTAKAAIIGMTRALARDLGGQGIRRRYGPIRHRWRGCSTVNA